MRLGDLDALKKEVENLVVGGEKGLKDYYKNGSRSDQNAWIGGVYDVWELICNATTVAVNCKDYDGYEAGYSAGLKDAERPQDDSISRSELKEFIKKNYKQTSQIKSLLSFIDTWKGGAE